MDPNRWKQIDEFVDAALDVAEEERAAFVREKAGDDADLERAVMELLEAQGKTSDFLHHSAMKIVAQAIANDEPAAKSQSLTGKKLANTSSRIFSVPAAWARFISPSTKPCAARSL